MYHFIVTMKTLYSILLFILPVSAIAQNEQTIILEKSKIHISTFGKGEPLLIINGGPGMSSQGFASLAKELGKTNLAILYDQRGTGQSTINSISENTMTMDLMVEDIENIRKHFKFQEWVVLGHSFGGMLASYYLKKHPNRIKRLILSGSGGHDLSITRNLNLHARLTQTERDSLNYWNERIYQGDTSYQARYNRGKYLAPAYVYNRKHVPIVAERLTQGNRTINSLIWQNIRTINFDCSDAFRDFKKPVLIIQGKQDVMGDTIAKQAHKLLTNSQLVFIDACAHYGWLEQPKAYYKNIHEFMKVL